MKITKILLPLDFSNCAAEAAQLACSLAQLFHAEIHLLHIIEPWPAAAMAPAESYPTKRAEELLMRYCLPDATAKAVRREVRIGDASEQILEYAREFGIDLIVIGSHGRTGVSHMLLGSVAEEVVRHARCAVMTVRHHREQSQEAGSQSAAERDEKET